MPNFTDLYRNFANFMRDQGLPNMKAKIATPGLPDEDPQGLYQRQVLNNMSEMLRPWTSSGTPEQEAANLRANQVPSLAPPRDLEKWGQTLSSILSPVDAETGMPNVDLGVVPLTKGGEVTEWIRKLKFPSSGKRLNNLEGLQEVILDIPPSLRSTNEKETLLRIRNNGIINKLYLHSQAGINTRTTKTLPPPPLYSQALNVAEQLKLNPKVPNTISSDSIKPLLTGYKDSKGNLLGVKQEELEWLGIDNLIKSKPKITKDELVKYIQDNQVHVEEIRGGNISPLDPTVDDPLSKRLRIEKDFTNEHTHPRLRLEGGTNYKEYIYKMTNPDVDFESAHWLGSKGRGNIAHIRSQDFTTESGKSAKHIEEAQSDLASALHDQSKRLKDPKSIWEYKASKILQEKGLEPVMSPERIAMIDQGISPVNQTIYTKPAPIVNKYHEFTAKRSLQLAAEEGKDVMTWTTGQQQIDRNNKVLLENIGKLEYHQGALHAYDPQGNHVKEVIVDIEELPKQIGEDLAEKLLRTMQTQYSGSRSTNSGKLIQAGASLTITPQTLGSGRGFINLYDMQFKKEVEKWVKKYGGEVRKERILVDKGYDPKNVFADYNPFMVGPEGNLSEQGYRAPKYEEVWSATITPQMRDAILPSRGGKGLPLFEAGAGAALLYDRYNKSQRDKQQKSRP